MHALNGARSSVDIAALWAQLDPLPEWAVDEPDALHGPALNRTFVELAARGLSMSLVTNDCNAPHAMFSCDDANRWQKDGVFNVSLVDWSGLLDKAWGVTHAKIMTVDDATAYSGSANLAWSSFAQTKELGLMIYNCAPLAQQYSKLMAMWRLAGQLGRVPDSWPSHLLPTFSARSPAQVDLVGPDGTTQTLHMAPCYSPTPFHYQGDDCAVTIVSLIDEAVEFVQISLMDYSPTTLYQEKEGHYPVQYWDTFDAALRRAALRGVQVQLLVSNWTMTFAREQPYWRSLDVLPNVEVRQFVMPPSKHDKAGGRVNHDKYFVTDKAAYIGTSNWSADYFEYFSGLGWTIRGGQVSSLLQKAHSRDWSSSYVHPLSSR